MSDLLNQASLVYIPSGYKEDIAYTVIPTDGSGDLTFTRASNGTRVNSAGFVENMPWNLVQYSEDFTNAVYAKYNNITATADQTTAPNGTTTADKIGLSTASTTFPNLAQNAQYIGGQVYTFTVYFKKNTVNFGKIRVGGTAFASSTNSPIFNLNTGVVVSGTGTIENVGNGWYRCSMTATADTSASGGFAIDLPDSAGVWSGSSVYNANDSIFAWGYMSNIGSTAKPYFPTTDRQNVPRLTYEGGCPSLLLEKQSTNKITYSEQFDNAAWTKLNSTITANSVTSPDGTQNADTITDNTTNGVHVTYQIPSGQSVGTAWTCYMKKGSLNYGYISAVQSTTFYTTAIINLTNGSIVELQNGSSTTGTVTTEDCGNGWYRVKMQTNANGAGYAVGTSNGSALSGTLKEAIYTGTGSGTIYLWGAQIEDSTYPTSYIPTTSSSATRVADECYKTGISSLIGQTEGTIFADVDLAHSSVNNDYILQIFQDSSNRILLYRSTGNVVGCYLLKAGGSIYDTTSVSAFTGRTKLAFAYKSGSIAFYVNGSQIGTSTATLTAFSSLSDLNIDSNNGAENGYFSYNQVILFPTRLTNAELASLTTI